jgi:hypothetical protein
LHQEIFQSLAEEPGEIAEQNTSVAKDFVTMVSKMADWYEANKELTRVIVERGRLIFSSEKCLSCLIDLANMIKHGQQTGEFRSDVSADDIARYVFVLSQDEKRNWVDSGCDYSLKEKIVDAAKFVLMGLRK